MQLEEQIAFNLLSKHPANSDSPIGNESDVAFLQHSNQIFFSTLKRSDRSPYSPIVNLIQGIYDSRPERALSMIRNRIFSTAKPTEMCLGMVNVAAKRLTSEIVPQNHTLSLSSIEYVEITNPRELSFSKPPAPNLKKPVTALLVSSDGTVLEKAVNTAQTNKTLHAEVNLVQNYYRRTQKPLPAHSRIYTTLKPCRMCAGMIWECHQDPSTLSVVFLENDPGPKALDTILDRKNVQTQENFQVNFFSTSSTS